MLNDRADIGVERILDVFGAKDERPRYGLMLHEFGARFGSDGWTMTDFRAAMQLAFDAGWVEIDAQFYRLTEAGYKKLKAASSTGDAVDPMSREFRKEYA